MKFQQLTKEPYYRLRMENVAVVFSTKQTKVFECSYYRNKETGKVYEVFKGAKKYRVHSPDGSVSAIREFDKE